MEKQAEDMDAFKVVISGEIDQLCNEMVDKKLM